MSGDRFTAWQDEAVERFVSDRLRRIVDAVTAQMGADLEAIVLSGGFGRGEGGVLRLAQGEFHVVNDFDVELVYHEPFGTFVSKVLVQLRHRKALQGLAERLAREFKMKQVDLALRGSHTLSKAVPKLADYDLLYGHRLLWGRANPCARMRRFASADIPAFEGTWLLRNRGIGLILARLYLDNGALDSTTFENFYIEINKAALAMGDALWILSGRYTVQYADRAANFDALSDMPFPRMAELASAYRSAAEYKLRPVAHPYPDVAPETLWNQTARLYVEFFLWFESQRLVRDVPDLAGYAAQVLAVPANSGGGPLRRWMDRRTGAAGECPPALRSLKYTPSHSVLFVAALLGARIGESTARDVLAKWPVTGTGTPDEWPEQARGLLALLHPSGEVGRFLAATRPDASSNQRVAA